MGRTSGLVTSARAPKTVSVFPGSVSKGLETPGLTCTGIARVFLMQNHPLMILGTSSFLNRSDGFTVSDSATTPAEAHGMLRAGVSADVAVYELSIPGPFNFAFLAKIRHEYPQLPILAFSCHEEVILARKALESGANGYLMKESPPEDLREALRQILEGETYLSNRMKARIDREASAVSSGPFSFLNGSLINSLSLEELHVLHLLGEGFSIERVQRELQFSRESLSGACRQIQKKLGLISWRELIRFAAHWVYYEGDFA